MSAGQHDAKLSASGAHRVPAKTFMDGLHTLEDVRKYAHVGFDGNLYPPTFYPAEVNKLPRARAAFLVLARNSDADDLRETMRAVEDRFNRKFGYPWIFLNNEPFDDDFKNEIKRWTRAKVEFGVIPKEHWSYPDHIDQVHAAAQREMLEENDVIYGGSESYRHMCRFNSGFFYDHPLTQNLDYYWRVEPETRLYCDIDYDPFLFMYLNNKKYGFTITIQEFEETIPTLWPKTRDFIADHPEYIAKDDARWFITDDGPDGSFDQDYNLCHFWSNFEIADLNFFRGKAYRDYFEFLDKDGGFFYERWGDAPVHSIAASLFLNRSELHHFEDIGYFHPGATHCPANKRLFHDTGKCLCKPDESDDLDEYLCMRQWWRTSIEGEPKRD
ncbi:hypothetical protein MVES1_002139 [Malassezia vespertilionis]|uniref:uncharacterized protein n=1 Tax=Malassezia vespertilionis TaxID=2020962 RepID=UPI0024B20F06|nr:uncharacterized protein MVES1_002139 [Malassezia vespertilionis]WFD06785.1 hypothetical protein MVES1_002139 [Malassezia vespertilionis]